MTVIKQTQMLSSKESQHPTKEASGVQREKMATQRDVWQILRQLLMQIRKIIIEWLTGKKNWKKNVTFIKNRNWIAQAKVNRTLELKWW